MNRTHAITGLWMLIFLGISLHMVSAAIGIQNAQAIDVGDTTATINWQTNQNATTRINYGIGNFNTIAQNPGMRMNHSILLQNLQRNATYSLSVVSCNTSGECTSIVLNITTTFDVDAPTINLTIPSFVNRRSIDLRGSTEAFSEVSLYINNFNTPARFLGRSDTGASGKIEFRNVILQDVNSIRLLTKDRSGNLNERIFEVRVDVDKPIVALQNSPLIISNSNISFVGSVSEPVTLKLWVRSSTEVSSPTKSIRNFRNLSVGQNSAALTWDPIDDPDFSHYILRRQDVGPIAIMQPKSYTSFTDILVDSGRNYAYTLSYMNKFGVESAQTNITTVRTPSGGMVLGMRPQSVDIEADFSTPDAQMNSSGAFSISERVGSSDGKYIAKLEATDRAGNVVTIERTFEKDTKKPEIQLLKPAQNALIFENYANEVDIEGTTEPGATVHLYLNRAPYQCNTTAWSVPRLLDDIKNLPDSALTATTSHSSTRTSLCPLVADMSTVADSTGRFKFEDADLFASFGLGVSVAEVPIDQFTTQNQNVQGTKRTRMILIATDKAGLRGAATSEVTVGNCWSGNVTWDVIPLTEFQTPTLLSTERLAENTETVYFYFNYSYIGRGTNAKIKSVSMQKACGNVEVLDSRFNTSCRIMPGGGNAQLLNPPENTISYTAMTLNRVENMDRWLENDWKSFFKGFNNELAFPLKLTITYQHDVEGRTVTEAQTSCQEVSFVMDNSRIDPRKALPDWLLYDFVDLLNASIHTIRQVQDQIDLIMPYIATACSTSYMASFGTSTWRNWQEMLTEKQIQVQALKDKVPGLSFGDVTFGDDQAYCEYLIKGFVYNPKYGNGYNFKLNWLSDGDLKKCFPRIADAWDYEATTYQAYRYTCDRLLGHVSPAGWTETKSDTELVNKAQQGSNCANDATPKGQVVRKVKCDEAAKSTAYQGKTLPSIQSGDYCLEIFQTTADGKQQKSLYKLGNTIDTGTGLTEISIGTSDKPQVELGAVIKVTEDNYLAPQKDTCNQICGGTSTTTLGASDTEFINPKEGDANAKLGKTNGKKAGVCTTAKQCIDWNSPNNPKNPISIKGQNYIIDRAERKGYTKGCFYGGGKEELNRYESVGKSLAERYECCCVYEKGVKGGYSYYDASDSYLDMDVANTVFAGADEMGVPDAKIPPIHKIKETETEGAYKPIEWSYRYSKVKFKARGTDGFEHTEYNPYRYIEGRDFPACFGQDMWFDTDKEVLTLDPARNHLATLQCANIGGIQQRLTMITNIMSAMQTCLIQVRTTGRGDTGACKELFTQHVCSLTWDAIQWFIHLNSNCASSNLQAPSSDVNQDGIVDYLKVGAKGIMNAMSAQQSEFMSEYGNVKLNSAFGAGAEETARKICLAAFGYEWPFSAKSLLDISYAQPFATLVQPITASRDLLSVDPKTGQAMMEYRGSWIINPGCDFANYKVELACIGRDALDSQANTWNGMAPLENGADCSKQRSPDGINCACLDSGEKVQSFFSSTNKLKQNLLEEKANHKVITSPYRYDHIKVTLLPDAKVDPKLRSKCFPEGRERGVYYFPITDRTARDITSCKIEPMSGVFMCSGGASFFGQKGFAYFNELFIGDETAKEGLQILTGKPITLRGSVFKSGGDKCLIATVSRPFVRTYMVSQITQNGTWPFGPVTVGDPLTISNRQQVVPPNGVSATLIESRSVGPTISIAVKFENKNNNAQLDTGDVVEIEGIRFDYLTSRSETSSDGKTTVVSDGSSLTVTKGDQVVRITGADFSSKTPGGKNLDRIEGAVLIHPPTESTTESQQTMTITLTLNNFKQGASPTNNIGDCNLNEIATSPEGVEQKRVYNLNLVNGGSVSNAVQIMNDRPEPSLLSPSNSMKYLLTTRSISPDIEIKSISTILSRGPSGAFDDSYLPQVAEQKEMIRQTTTNVESSYSSKEYKYDEFPYAGVYKIRAMIYYSQPGKEGSQTLRGPERTVEIACAQNAQCRDTSNGQCPSSLYPVPQSSRSKECVGTQICCSTQQQPTPVNSPNPCPPGEVGCQG